ncbi:ankyrin repeat domain-containing protein [Pigmentibacter sp. JX0631]|uniref:ankyrin repeat domain-containing protein n=1 Tax=Pigmentibacter sp. JX0631 TaxID=2976982 RepID=UPI002468FA09|nr:ankyrin repeat domain-containing protein [Pigmentibacter sp. JX0631]WGL60322.1 ankyrin repeat domain-containing protein [Pigmentibacter sp. JX0631]
MPGYKSYIENDLQNKNNLLSLNTVEHLRKFDKIPKDYAGLCAGISCLWLICMENFWFQNNKSPKNNKLYYSKFSRDLKRKKDAMPNLSKALEQNNIDKNTMFCGLALDFNIEWFYNNISSIQSFLHYPDENLNKNEIIFIETIKALFKDINNYLYFSNIGVTLIDKLELFLANIIDQLSIYNYLCIYINAINHAMALFAELDKSSLNTKIKLTFFDPNINNGQLNIFFNLDQIYYTLVGKNYNEKCKNNVYLAFLNKISSLVYNSLFNKSDFLKSIKDKEPISFQLFTFKAQQKDNYEFEDRNIFELNINYNNINELPFLLNGCVRLGNLKAFEYLLDKLRLNINLNFIFPDGYTLYHLAAIQNQIFILKYLNKFNHLNPNIPLTILSKEYPIHSAIANKKIEILKVILKKGNIDVYSLDKFSLSPIGYCIFFNNLEALELILAYPNFDPNKIFCEITALEYAMNCDNLECFKKILFHPKTDPNTLNTEQFFCLYLASSKGKYKYVEILLTHPNLEINKTSMGFTSLHVAVTQDDPKMIKLLLTHPKIDANLLNPSHNSALFMAVKDKKIDCITALLSSNKVNVDSRDDKSFNILTYLTRERLFSEPMERAILNKLLNVQNLNPNIACFVDDNTPLHFAVINKDIDVVKSLLKMRNINKNLKNAENKTPKEIAIEKGYLEIAKIL